VLEREDEHFSHENEERLGARHSRNLLYLAHALQQVHLSSQVNARGRSPRGAEWYARCQPHIVVVGAQALDRVAKLGEDLDLF
jgi:hypothetical protein